MQADSTDERRQAAIEQLTEKRNFRTHLVIYAAVNTMLIVIWAVSGAGYFWPVWPLAGWGLAVALQAYRVYFGPRPFTESDIRAEMDRSG